MAKKSKKAKKSGPVEIPMTTHDRVRVRRPFRNMKTGRRKMGGDLQCLAQRCNRSPPANSWPRSTPT
jgi:hypothetical protein